MLGAECGRRDGQDGAWCAARAGTRYCKIVVGQAYIFEWRVEGVGHADRGGDCGYAVRLVWASTRDGGLCDRLWSGHHGPGRSAERNAPDDWRSSTEERMGNG